MNSLHQVSWFLNEGAKADRRADGSNAWLWWACVSEWSQVGAELNGYRRRRQRGLPAEQGWGFCSEPAALKPEQLAAPLVWWLGPFCMRLWGLLYEGLVVKPLKFHVPWNLPFPLIFVHGLEWMKQFILGTSIKGQIVKWQLSVCRHNYKWKAILY